jgi:hypothetical protein
MNGSATASAVIRRNEADGQSICRSQSFLSPPVSGRNPSPGAGRPSADLVNAAGEIERAYRQIVVRASIAVDPAVLTTHVGVYELRPTLSIAITLENGQLTGRDFDFFASASGTRTAGKPTNGSQS